MNNFDFPPSYDKKENYESEVKEIVVDKSAMSLLMTEQERANVDMQIETAIAHPRDVPKILKDIEFWTFYDSETTESCFYAIPRKDKNGKIVFIRGASIRFAEIVLSNWCNLRIKTTIIGNDNKYVTAEAAIWDLEKNTAVMQQVRRRITNKEGITYNDDLIVSHTNAACSIALRNVVFKIIPTVITKGIQNKIKKVIFEKESFIEIQKKALKYFSDNGISEKQILKVLDLNELKDMTKDHLLDLRGIVTAISEGDTTFDDIFNINKTNTASAHIASKLGVPPTIILPEKEKSTTSVIVPKQKSVKPVKTEIKRKELKL